MFVMSILPVALLYFRWRMVSGSIWPIVIAHGAWNVVTQAAFDGFTRGVSRTRYTGSRSRLAISRVIASATCRSSM